MFPLLSVTFYPLTCLKKVSLFLFFFSIFVQKVVFVWVNCKFWQMFTEVAHWYCFNTQGCKLQVFIVKDRFRNNFKLRCVNSILGGTLRSRHGTFVDFDKICVFCGKCYVRIDICVFIVVKINVWILVEFVIKLTLLQNYTYFTTPDRHLSKQIQHFIRTHTNITNFDTFGGTVPQRDLRISQYFSHFVY